tara:strand:- start:316 stop:444 length:129 start_codon:yes stop_codon:yes gene_type:complete
MIKSSKNSLNIISPETRKGLWLLVIYQIIVKATLVLTKKLEI